MKNKIIILWILLVQTGFAQQNTDTRTFSSKAAEEVFIHFNSALLLPGESLYYKVYNLNKEEHNPSEISRLINVKLLNSNNKEVFHHKLNLGQGTGYSDYLIPADLPSGVYTLFGYTNWMRNYDLKGAFEAQIVIVNPYLTNNSNNISISNEEQKDPDFKNSLEKDNNSEIRLNKSSYGKRERVNMSLIGDLERIQDANISVSVRKLDDIVNHEIPTSKNFNTSKIEDFELKYLPEMRGRIISGKVENENYTSVNKNLAIAYYVPNAPEKFRIFETSNDGSFKFVLEEPVENEKAFLKVTENSEAEYRFILDSAIVAYETRPIEKIVIPANVKLGLEQRAVYNQIQQSYISVMKDSIALENKEIDFYGDNAIVYDLDEYTRFSTMEEVFVEIIQFATFKKNKDVYIPNVKGYNLETDFGSPSLLLIDGVMVLDYNDFYYMDAKLVEKISIVRDKYFYGPEIYQGIIMVETIKKDMPNLKADYNIELLPTEPKKYYYSPVYSSAEQKDALSRIPDYRSQLLWQPEIRDNNLEFFTSDIPGIYQIKIEGFQNNGKAVSIEKTFEVKD